MKTWEKVSLAILNRPSVKAIRSLSDYIFKSLRMKAFYPQNRRKNPSSKNSRSSWAYGVPLEITLEPNHNGFGFLSDA
jgi:hypothetical protein